MTGAEELKQAVAEHYGEAPFDLAVILGSGLGAATEGVEQGRIYPYAGFSCFPRARVAGHAGQLLVGRLQSWRVLFFLGRFHLYQGLQAREVCVPVRVARLLGCHSLLLTNAVGGIRHDLVPGSFMAVCDHINLQGDNPLRGESDDPFLDLSRLYEQDYVPALQAFARQRGVDLAPGVLAAVSGPCYETPAEVRALERLGADAVSMSTVPEAIFGKYLGMRVAALSFVANRAAGLSPSPLSHREVLAAGSNGAETLAELIGQLLAFWQPAA